MLLLTLAALVPPIILMVIIYNKDRTEKEPIGLILKLLFAGALSTIPAGIIEYFCEGALLPAAGLQQGTLLYQVVFNFLVVAWTEEGVKHFALKRITWTHPAFDYTFDAMVYTVAVGLGFAMVENIQYVFNYGLSTAIMRAITAIPGHCIFGIHMGYFYGLSRFHLTHFRPARSKAYMFCSMLIPVLLHGTYDLMAGSRNPMLEILFFAYLVVMDIVAVITVNRFQKKDLHI
ncbi:MAG: PrsW family glutamic-type intramembrane protease [Eubacteriales bacterium]|nr:PrsW family glutamic-type intramembrane protease [Eubacteriales bacterium]